MKKWTMVLVLLFCGTCLFAQSFFDIVKTGTREQIEAALQTGVMVDERGDAGMTPLMYAVKVNMNPDFIMTLLQAGANANERDNSGMTPLMYAASDNMNPDIITILLKAGAKVDEQDESGMTPLMYAARFNHNANVIIALKNAGARANDGDQDGITPLMYAVEYNKYPDVIKALLEAGADIDARDNDGWTALMYSARECQNPDVITTLLDAGADATLRSDRGYTALDFAQYNYWLQGTPAYKALRQATAAATSNCVSTSFGSYRVERMWEEYGSTYVLVSYRNTTSTTFRSLVTVTALVYDANNHMLDMTDRSFFASDTGPIVSGFEGTVKIQFSFVGAKRVEIRLQGH